MAGGKNERESQGEVDSPLDTNFLSPPIPFGSWSYLHHLPLTRPAGFLRQKESWEGLLISLGRLSYNLAGQSLSVSLSHLLGVFWANPSGYPTSPCTRMGGAVKFGVLDQPCSDHSWWKGGGQREDGKETTLETVQWELQRNAGGKARRTGQESPVWFWEKETRWGVAFMGLLKEQRID